MVIVLPLQCTAVRRVEMWRVEMETKMVTPSALLCGVLRLGRATFSGYLIGFTRAQHRQQQLRQLEECD